MKDSWEEVRRLREEADEMMRAGISVMASYYDNKASQMAERLRAAEKEQDS